MSFELRAKIPCLGNCRVWLRFLDQLRQRLAGVVFFHQRFADEKGIVSGSAQVCQIGGGTNAAFGDSQALLGNFVDQPEGCLQTDFERAQIAAIDADKIAARIEGAVEFLLVMRFAEHVELVPTRGLRKRHEFLLSQRGDDQQDGVGGVCACFQDLEFVDDEILSQAGKRSGGRGCAQVGKRALEELLVGEHGERGGAC